MRASSAPVMSVTGCEYTPSVTGRPNCAITVKGSWWRPTISMPNTRSDGARRTGAAIAAVTTTARVRTAATSATRPDNVDHRGDDQQGAGNRPAPDVGHTRRESRVAGEGVQREQACRLREPEDCQSGEEAPPAGR